MVSFSQEEGSDLSQQGQVPRFHHLVDLPYLDVSALVEPPIERSHLPISGLIGNSQVCVRDWHSADLILTSVIVLFLTPLFLSAALFLM